MNDDFSLRLYTIIATIPKKSVITDDELANLARAPRNACQVDYIPRCLPKDSKLPWYHTVNHQEKISL